MEMKQKEIKLKAKDEIILEGFFGDEETIMKGQVIKGLLCDIGGLQLIGLYVNNEISYYYQDHITQKFEVIEDGDSKPC